MRPVDLRSALFALLFLIGGLPCFARADWERVLPGLELTFPRDHGAHPRTRIEWWYLTGQVEARDGRRFGFQFTVFRRGMALPEELPEGSSDSWRARQVYAGHLAVTDVGASRTRFAERLRRGGSPLARASEERLDVVIEDWSLRRDEEGRLLVRAGDAEHGLDMDLVLTPSKPLVLHGDRGYSSKGADPGNASAYFSWTRLLTRGRLAVDGEQVEVEGLAWFDHEFGTSVLEPGVDGWDWFGLHLDDGRDLMLFVLRKKDGTFGAASAGTLVGPNGETRALRRGDFTLTSSGEWKSPRTDGVYPTRWTLAVPSEDIELTVRPLVPDCELVTGGSTGVAYWEGPVEVSGTTTGRGYAELTGYAGSMDGRF